jgi:hypothetical protein
MVPLAALLALVASVGAPPPEQAHGEAERAPATSRPSAQPSRAARARIVAAARRHVGKPFRGDCSAFVRRVYAEAGVALPDLAGGRSAAESMFRSLVAVRRPQRGDLAFFHRTYDRDAPGPGRDRFTHVALVESVDGPRVSLIHRGGAGVRRIAMNLARPSNPDENDAIRRKRAGDRPGQRYLASQLLAGFASALAPPPRVARAGRATGSGSARPPSRPPRR